VSCHGLSALRDGKANAGDCGTKLLKQFASQQPEADDARG
jgi:hypothetical protein